MLSFPVSATNIYVDYFHGDDQNPGTSWPNAKKTIAEAIVIAQEFDVIHVSAGHYTNHIDLIRGIKIFGGYPPGGGNRNPNVYITELDGGESRQIMIGADQTEIDGLTFKKGYAAAGSGLKISESDMIVRNCIFKQNTAFSDDPDGGGAIFFFNSSSVIIDCVFEGNRLESDSPQSGLYMTGGAVMSWSSSPVFIRCTFQENQIVNPDEKNLALGGAVFMINSRLHFCECSFTGNNAGYGGAISWWNHSAPIIINSIFDGNSATDAGGAVASMASSDEFSSLIDGCIFSNNQSVSGGAVAGLQQTNINISNCLFWDNSASDRGGAIFSIHGSVFGISGSTLEGNILTGGIGRGGAGIYFSNKTEYTILSNIIVNGLYGEGIYFGDAIPPGTSIVWNNCVYNNTRGNYGGAIPDLTGIDGNISVDPLFVSSGNCDYCLSHHAAGQDETSLCVDTGYADFHRMGSTRTDSAHDYYPVDIGYHSNSTYSKAYLKNYYFTANDNMTLYLLNGGDKITTDVVLYVALQIEDEFWFAKKEDQSLYFTDDPDPFSQHFQLEFDMLQEIFSIQFPDEPLPSVKAYWHIATVDPETSELYDYHWTAFEL